MTRNGKWTTFGSDSAKLSGENVTNWECLTRSWLTDAG